MIRGSVWTRFCPVCRGELPERGNRRVRLPWKPGWALVHDGECYERVVAQGMLDLEPTRRPIDPVLLVQAQRRVMLLLSQPAKHSLEELHAIACERVALLAEKFNRDEAGYELDRSPEHLRELVQRVLVHDREVSGPGRTEGLIFGGRSS